MKRGLTSNQLQAYRSRYQESGEETQYGVAEGCHYRSHLQRWSDGEEKHSKVREIEYGAKCRVKIPKSFSDRPVEAYCWICDYNEDT